jgi:polygalacturonase
MSSGSHFRQRFRRSINPLLSHLLLGEKEKGNHMRLTYALIVLLFALPTNVALHGQDTRKVSEPKFPTTCAVFQAPLKSDAKGPAIGSTVEEQDAESDAETATLDAYLKNCNGQAVELTLGSDPTYNAFLVNPVGVPPGVSLIVDGGVTVYGTRDPLKYQVKSAPYSCGTLSARTPDPICEPLITFDPDDAGSTGRGLYGYGVIDGQGDRRMFATTPAVNPVPWWHLIQEKVGDKSNNANSPYMISAGETKGSPASNLTLYKITLRNPPFHTVYWNGNGLTVWGVKIQAPWNVPNTDGFDLHGTNETLYETSVSNGDDDIAFATTDSGPTSNITVNRFSVYSRDGITVLGDGNSTTSPVSNLLIENITITGDLPSVVGTTVNGMTEAEMKTKYGLSSYGQALPNVTGNIAGLNIKYTPNKAGSGSDLSTSADGGAKITDVTFQSVCMQDIEKAINIIAESAVSPDSLPTVSNITFRDIHELAPTIQFPEFTSGIPAVPAAPGSYKLDFEGDETANFSNQFTFDNVVFDDLPSGPSLSQITAKANVITTVSNVYPAVLNGLDGSGPPSKTVLKISDTSYASKTPINSESLAYRCRRGPAPFLTGEFYAAKGAGQATGAATNLSAMTAVQGNSITLNAVVEPIMTPTTFFMRDVYGSNPGLLAVGSPKLTNSVLFYDGLKLLGGANLSANGTLASLVVKNVAPGWHIYRAQYPADSFYSTLDFGLVVVFATPRKMVP